MRRAEWLSLLSDAYNTAPAMVGSGMSVVILCVVPSAAMVMVVTAVVALRPFHVNEYPVYKTRNMDCCAVGDLVRVNLLFVICTL